MISRGEYYRTLYLIASSGYLGASILFGVVVPGWWKKTRLRKTWMWLFIQGAVAWLVVVLVLSLVSLTPLCVGQDNGDGTNDLFLCIFQSAAVSVVYSPVVILVLGLSALLGGWVIDRAVQPGTGN